MIARNNTNAERFSDVVYPLADSPAEAMRGNKDWSAAPQSAADHLDRLGWRPWLAAAVSLDLAPGAPANDPGMDAAETGVRTDTPALTQGLTRPELRGQEPQ